MYEKIIKAQEVSLTLDIKTIEDLIPLRGLYKDNKLKLNLSEIARSLNIDRRTVKRFLLVENEKTNTRNRLSEVDEYKEYIIALLKDPNKKFIYFNGLYNYLKVSKNITFSYSTFTHYLRKSKDLLALFNKDTKPKSLIPSNNKIGIYAELDWKENIQITLKNGEIVSINILVLILAHSRYRVVRMSLSKSQEVLMHLLVEMFCELGGVPKIIKCDNMKTIMELARTTTNKGIVNKKFEQFAKDMGFTIEPCIVHRPNTKGHVEQPNRIFDNILAFGGELSLIELNSKIKELAKFENERYHQTYGLNPSIEFLVEKKSLIPLPKQEIRDYYTIKTVKRIVSDSSRVTYDNIQYSVPTKYIKQTVLIRCFDNLIHIYSNIPEFKIIYIHKKADETNCIDRIVYAEEHFRDVVKEFGYNEQMTEQLVNNYFENLKNIKE